MELSFLFEDGPFAPYTWTALFLLLPGIIGVVLGWTSHTLLGALGWGVFFGFIQGVFIELLPRFAFSGAAVISMMWASELPLGLFATLGWHILGIGVLFLANFLGLTESIIFEVPYLSREWQLTLGGIGLIMLVVSLFAAYSILWAYIVIVGLWFRISQFFS